MLLEQKHTIILIFIVVCGTSFALYFTENIPTQTSGKTVYVIKEVGCKVSEVI